MEKKSLIIGEEEIKNAKEIEIININLGNVSAIL